MNQYTITRAYDVRDLVPPEPSDRFYPSRTTDYDSGGLFSEETTRTGSGSGGRGLFGEPPARPVWSGPSRFSGDREVAPEVSERGVLLDEVEPEAPELMTRYERGGSYYESDSRTLTSMIADDIDPANWRSAGGTVGSMRFFNGILVVTQTVENHEKLEKLLAMLRRYRPTPNAAPVTGMPEQMFSSRGQLMPWVLALIERVRSGKLSPFSSVAVRKIRDRTFAGIGGFWFDTRLTERTRIIPVARYSPADELLKMQGHAYAELLGEDLVAVALDSQTAVVMSQWGIASDDHADLKTVLAAMK